MITNVLPPFFLVHSVYCISLSLSLSLSVLLFLTVQETNKRTYLWTRKSLLNFGDHPYPDPDQICLGGGVRCSNAVAASVTCISSPSDDVVSR